MKLTRANAEVWAPDGSATADALARTTHMAIAAHQDDIEIMAMAGILECFGADGKAFLGVIATDGAGSPRDAFYARYSDEEMQKVRRVEQKKAAFVGEYSAVVFLDYPSAAMKAPGEKGPVADIQALLAAAQPEILYTHNLADKHDTHVATALRVISAVRALPASNRPKHLYGCEVWRDLDWMTDADKAVFGVDGHENLSAALLGVFDSQIAGGKRYDLATLGRRRAHATYYQSHSVDAAKAITFAMDLTPLIQDDGLDPAAFVDAHIQRFAAEVGSRIAKLG